MQNTVGDLPGFRPGEWVLDPDHSEVGFTVRHMMVSKVRGSFGVKSASLIATEDPLVFSLTATVDAASVNTNLEARDLHLRSAEFLDVENFPTIQFESKSASLSSDCYIVNGDLTIRGVTRSVDFKVEFGGFGPDTDGRYRAGASAVATINREDFGLTWNATIETGGLVVGKEVTILLELEGFLLED
ncbi:MULTISPECIES: YceI family protein [Paenarthrobacter]|uniref:YceI family protein n=1 Tax=Paenarthrobacter ureafaciens TaxID=37931 RepID=A0AAX3EQI6_PAEUR|nr:MULTISPECIES: YceI family protein [Paenarthrobacter]NKR09948.1 polyisoprenoid-binding protein [Arthrobacter sp. M5]NKR17036.1 polyisoprenoid-binding protein [Arthrobacter sp. M6]MDO5862908.1 YceI family protein [Paenarthrobacter sp. SD-2]MDO5878109.1 YceI family protein [Paenarthrobacter sp. SD-1]QMU80984.1 YceI family protein [Paenarthrobacter ureafaciens]